MKLPEIILASASPRRAELLRQIGVAFRVMPVDIDESLHRGEVAVDYVLRLAREKALAGAGLAHSQALELAVLGADTIVELEGEILGKPVDADHARDMLSRLSGKSHHVHTAISLDRGDEIASALSTSVVVFAKLSEAEIGAYVASGEPMDKAGAYAIQGGAARFVKNLNGSYSGVMGLPLYETVQLLKTCRASA